MIEVVQAFAAMRPVCLAEYTDYWDDLTARDDKEYFQRFLFAFCSVHTGWKSNVKGYTAIKEYHPDTWTDEKLRDTLHLSGVGMHNNRAKYISAFARSYWANPGAYRPDKDEPLYFVRNRLSRGIKGLGLAKTSFALEMAYPTAKTQDIACLDVHMLRLYGQQKLNGRASIARYGIMESDWVGRSVQKGVAPYVARMVYWDTVQDKPDTRYWSHCLERSTSDIKAQDASEVPGHHLDGVGGLRQERHDSEFGLERQPEGSERDPGVHVQQSDGAPGQSPAADRDGK